MVGQQQQAEGTRRWDLPLIGTFECLARLLLLAGSLVMILFLCGAAIFFGSLLFKPGAPVAHAPSRPTTQLSSLPTSRPVLPTSSPVGIGLQVGQLVTTSAIDPNAGGRPVTPANTFPRNTQVMYAVLYASKIPSGTTAFARWTRQERPFEDSSEIRAARDYTDTHLTFSLRPTPGKLALGSYAVQVFLNGAPGPKTEFNVR